MVDAIRRENCPGMMWVPPWPASNHYMFYSYGVPSIALCFTGDVPNVIHQPTDTIEWISPTKLAEVVSLATGVVNALQDKPSDWCRLAEL